MKVIQRIALTAVVLLGILAMGVYAAPGFLLYTTPYEKSDAIVLLLGPDFSARHRHAQDLLQKGVSDFLIIPAYRKIYFMDEGVIKTLSSQIQKDKFPNSGSHVPPYFEDTHVELLEAKKNDGFTWKEDGNLRELALPHAAHSIDCPPSVRHGGATFFLADTLRDGSSSHLAVQNSGLEKSMA